MADSPYAPSPLDTPPPPARPVTPTPPAPATSATYAPSPMPATPVVQPARPVTPSPYTPSEISTALVNAGVPPSVAPTLTAISGAESGFGRSQISPTNKDGSRDHGVFQVNDKAWPQFQNVAAQPLQTQAAMAAHIYNQQGLKAWSTYNNGAYKKFLDSNAPIAPATATPPATPGRTSAAQDLAAAYKAGNVGGMLGALSKGQDDSGKGSALNNLSDTLNQKATSAPSQQLLPQAQRAPDTSGPSQQLLSQVIDAQAKPLSWSSTPFGSDAGPQNVPGVTLNSAPSNPQSRVLSQYSLNPMYSGG